MMTLKDMQAPLLLPASAAGPLVDVVDLRVRFAGHANEVVSGVSFSLEAGECLALVGESGSGKSVTSRTLAGLSGRGARIEAQRLVFAGQPLDDLNAREWRALRGKRIGFVMQDALGSLDPLRLVGQEVSEPLRHHDHLDRHQRQARAIELLRAVGVPEPELRASLYPYQLSGGLRQRALIASAIACNPELLIADEPTTALDATVQAQVLDLLESLREARDNALLLVSHDMAVVARLADRIAVMQHGRIVEQGSREQVLYDPRHPYTQSLLRAAAAVHVRFEPRPAAATPSQAEVVLATEGLGKQFHTPNGQPFTAVAPTSLELRAGETLGIVGESGSGKTTLTRMILGLEQPDQGRVLIESQDWSSLDAQQQRNIRRRIQVVFQDPLSAFDPRHTVERILGEALGVAGYRGQPRRQRLLELLALVRLPATLLKRRPLELSGGQRQRIAIARALAAEPDILVCDEPVSALDVSVQAQVLALLVELKQRLGLSCLFISHDLGVVQSISDRVLVMKDGHVVEQGAVHDVFHKPRHAYTRTLLAAIPTLYILGEKGVRLEAIAY